jgi:energy-converting hydrogenase Eha subunit A
VGWFILLPVVLSRRSIDQMRGARVAAAFLSAVPLVTAAILLLRPPHARFGPTRYDWGWGIFATALIALVATAAAVRFGGRADDIRVSRGSAGEPPRSLN